ncbi:MAG: YqhA family protein [Alphaproteobacteria bacterium]|nr:YqhA family protein [Alphaproteobacteria bacterium]
MPNRFERFTVAILLGSRWLAAPLYFGLIGTVIIVLVEFFREWAHLVAGFADITGKDLTLAILKLIDLVLIGNLILILVAAGAEIISARAVESDHGGRPDWMGSAAFGSIKLKIIASLAAIAAVDLLESFFNIESTNKTDLLWEIATMLAFGAVGVLLAWMDRLASEPH